MSDNNPVNATLGSVEKAATKQAGNPQLKNPKQPFDNIGYFGTNESLDDTFDRPDIQQLNLTPVDSVLDMEFLQPKAKTVNTSDYIADIGRTLEPVGSLTFGNFDSLTVPQTIAPDEIKPETLPQSNTATSQDTSGKSNLTNLNLPTVPDNNYTQYLSASKSHFNLGPISNIATTTQDIFVDGAKKITDVTANIPGAIISAGTNLIKEYINPAPSKPEDSDKKSKDATAKQATLLKIAQMTAQTSSDTSKVDQLKRVQAALRLIGTPNITEDQKRLFNPSNINYEFPDTPYSLSQIRIALQRQKTEQANASQAKPLDQFYGTAKGIQNQQAEGGVQGSAHTGAIYAG